MDDRAHDPVERFLHSPPRAEDSLPWRDGLLFRTSGVLRRRRIVRRMTAGAALAACFLAGGLVAWFVKPESSSVRPPDIAAHPLPEPKAPGQSKTPKDISQERMPAVAQEWDAFDASAQRARKFREAGDRYLHESQDVQAALRCYTQALDAGGDEELIVTPSDSWLLIALKDARQKEKNHALGGS
jgi:hypothetical protein